MPIYEYACSACGHQLDALQKLSDTPLVDCPECGAPQLKRQVSAPSFRLKGGGWYETDFKNDKRRNISESDSKAAEGKAAEKADAKTDGKSDTKPDTKPEAKPASADKPAPAETKKAEPTPAKTKPDAGKAGGVA